MTDSIRFPPEIFDGILDHVHNLDEEARSTYSGLDISIRNITTKPVKNLLSCSLVCRSWLPRTRLHSFNTIHLPPDDRAIGIAFGALVAHPLCTFRSHVRRLSLHEGFDEDPAGELWLNSVLPQLALLTNVEDVSIYHAQFTDLSDEEEWRAGVQFFGPQLKRLEMQSTQFDQVIRMTELVSHCYNLEHLALRYIYKDEDPRSPFQGGDIVVRTPPSQFLQSLTLQHGITMSAEFLEWLCPSPGAIKIPAVELKNISVKNALHVSRFLHVVGPSITSLAIGFSESLFDSTDGQDAFCRVADLTTLTNLESLQFGLLTIYPIHMGRGLSVQHVPHILAKLDAPSLKEIRFHVSMVEQAADFEMINWESIVPTLNGAHYPTLEVLLFKPIKEDAMEETKAWLDENVRRKLRRNIEIRCATTY